MATEVSPMPIPAQRQFLHTMQTKVGIGHTTALQLWQKLNAFLVDKKQFLSLPMASIESGILDRNYYQVERGILPYLASIVTPILGGLAVCLGSLALGASAPLAAILTILVFLVLFLRKGGSLDTITLWMDDKLKVLTQWNK